MPKEPERKPVSSPDAPAAAWHAPALAAGLLVLAFLFAQVEIQIEGPAGWARDLPTWRVDQHPLLDVFWGGKPLTGYHAWVFAFMAAVFHLPLLLTGRFTWRLELRALGSVMVFWILEDALWFALNPAFGLHRLTPAFVPWHKHWIMGVPTDYPLFLIAGIALIACSFRRPRTSCSAPHNRCLAFARTVAPIGVARASPKPGAGLGFGEAGPTPPAASQREPPLQSPEP